MATAHGIPLLSGAPPTVDSDACRKCNKEFNLFFTRSRKCNHCGYSYCHSCSDFQALLPRPGTSGGYDAVHVCAYCIELLNVTASGPGHLRAMPLSKLKTYASSYNIDISRAVEKNDIIEAILRARGPNGCLPQFKEDFYRKNKVPNPHSGSRPRGLFSRGGGDPPPVPPRPPPPQARSGGPNSHPRFPQSQAAHPPYEPSYGVPPQPQGYPYQTYNSSYQSQPHYNNMPPYHQNFQRQPPQPPPQETRPPRPPSRSNSTNANRSARPPPRPQTPPRTPPRPRTNSTPTQSPPPQPPPALVPTPTLDQLLVMTQSSIAALSVSVLKSILFMNHVNVTMVLEKSELVKKVVALVDDEKRERERQRMIEEAERFEEEERKREREEAIRREEEEKVRKERKKSQRATVEDVEEGIDEMLDVEMSTVMDEDEDVDDGFHQEPSSSSSPPPKVSSSPNHHAMPSVMERSGLCVICQDEEANIAIVDCGHMVMCRACSELIMSSSKECPLCRTRIVTEARLLRIFKS